MRIFIALALICAAACVVASPESEALKRQGRDALGAGRFAEAGERFLAATRADPRDFEAAYLHGVAANRLGQFSVAETSLQRAEAGGYRSAELDFELGWVAMAGGRGQACVERLERYEAAVPGRGQTSEFLGRCHLALRQYDKAEAMLKRALARDPRLAPTVNLSLATLEQARGKPEAARAHLESVVSGDAPTGRALRELAGPPDPVIQPDKPLRLALSLSLGHNDNVIGLGNTIPLPTDISRKSANYTRLSGGASFTNQLDPATAVTLGYALLVDRYEGLGSANLVDNYLYADFFRQATDRLAMSLRASSQVTELAGRRFRDVVGLRPAISYRFTSDSVTEFAYTFSDSSYKTPVAAAFSRDGDAHSLSAVHSFRLRGTNWSGAVGATYGENRSEGSDFRSDSLGASGTLRYTFPNKIVAALGLSATRDNYKNLNSLAGAGFAFAREDRQNVVSGQVAGPISDKLRWFVQAQKLRNRSNISFYDYRQNGFSAGVAADF